MTFAPRPLPDAARQLCGTLAAPPRLVAHLTLVHDAAAEIVEGLRRRFPPLDFDKESVVFGAAAHDLGKVRNRSELTGPGKRHETDGPRLLEDLGVSAELARFARTHGAWSRESLSLEDLLVATADCVWKGQWIEALESQVVALIAEKTGIEQWKVFDLLDQLLEGIAARGDERLAWQRSAS